MTERNGYYAEQNAKAMAYAIIENPKVIDVITAYEFFCKCINEAPSYITKPDGSVAFRLNGSEVAVFEDERKLDPLVEVIEHVVFDLHYSKQK